VNLRSGRVLRIGHRGAAALAPENSIASIEAAIDHGVDLVEMDVVESDGRLRLAHGPAALTAESPLLEEALELLARHGTGAMVDLKSAGIEGGVVALLAEHGLVERALVASFRAGSLRAVKELEPALTTGFAYPYDRAGISQHRAMQPLIRAGLAGLRRALPRRIAGMLAHARADAAVLHWALISGPLVARCHDQGSAVLAWTVEDDLALERVLAAGVDGVIANDPRLLRD
jgi:glycerophosphoryl diester phosphodiesterase